jgi:hypothetical protein
MMDLLELAAKLLQSVVAYTGFTLFGTRSRRHISGFFRLPDGFLIPQLSRENAWPFLRFAVLEWPLSMVAHAANTLS